MRIRHVDSLRAVAAGLVVWLHYAQFLAPHAAPGPAALGWARTFPRDIDVGRLGVLIFFAVSGFVICRSFGGPSPGGARRFLVRRFCRLYPAFWASVAVGWLACRAAGQTWGWPALLANATMLPDFLGQPYLLGVYWTLEIELLFYGLCLGLFLARRLEHRGVLAAGVLLLIWLPAVLKGVGHHAGIRLGIPHAGRTAMLELAIMFWGVLFRLAYDATGGFRRGVLATGGTWLAAALLVFTLWVAVLRVDNRALTFLGVISDSLYLFHLVPPVLAEHLLAPGGSRWRAVPFWVDFLACGGVSVALAAAVYRWVERPAIALGKRWAATPGVSAGGPPR